MLQTDARLSVVVHACTQGRVLVSLHLITGLQHVSNWGPLKIAALVVYGVCICPSGCDEGMCPSQGTGKQEAFLPYVALGFQPVPAFYGYSFKIGAGTLVHNT